MQLGLPGLLPVFVTVMNTEASRRVHHGHAVDGRTVCGGPSLCDDDKHCDECPHAKKGNDDYLPTTADSLSLANRRRGSSGEWAPKA